MQNEYVMSLYKFNSLKCNKKVIFISLADNFPWIIPLSFVLINFFDIF